VSDLHFMGRKMEMRMRKIGLISLALAAALLPSTTFAGRLDGFFATQEKDQPVDTNDACIETFGDDFSAFGTVTSVDGTGCTVNISYNTPLPHKGSSTALKTGKVNGSSKVSQTIFTNFVVVVTDTDADGAGTCSIAPFLTPFIASVQEEVEKCKVTASMKGTDVTPDPDTVQSSNVSASCEFGEAGVDLVVTSPVQDPTTPTQPQIDVVVNAFANRSDVKIANNGKVSIKHKGVPETSTTFAACD
jgi:hypothetical protein